MRSLPPLNSLKAFEVAARELSFTKAAAELHVTHGAISYQVRQLEEFLGCALFQRLPQGLQLTPRGAEFSAVIKGAFRQVREGVEAVRTVRERQIIMVSTLPSLAAHWLVSRLESFQKVHPDVEVRLSATCDLVDFERDDIDLAIRYGRGHWPRLTVCRLFRPVKFPVCAPQLLNKPHLVRAPRDLARLRLLHDSDHSDWLNWFALSGAGDVDACSGLVVEDMNVLIQAALSGQGVLMASKPLVIDELKAGRLVKPFDIDLPVDNGFYAVYPKTHTRHPLVTTMVDWLQEQADAP